LYIFEEMFIGYHYKKAYEIVVITIERGGFKTPVIGRSEHGACFLNSTEIASFLFKRFVSANGSGSLCELTETENLFSLSKVWFFGTHFEPVNYE
jgi:hypothetical protein